MVSSISARRIRPMCGNCCSELIRQGRFQVDPEFRPSAAPGEGCCCDSWTGSTFRCWCPSSSRSRTMTMLSISSTTMRSLDWKPKFGDQEMMNDAYRQFLAGRRKN